MLASKLLSAAGGTETLFVDDVFQTVVRSGNGATSTITNGIDLSGKGGLLWVKSRSDATSHYLFDTVRGTSDGALRTNATSPTNTAYSGKYSFSSTGYSVTDTSSTTWEINGPSSTYVDFVFRKAPKFFDCGTFTAGSSTNRRISHALGVAPGIVIVKHTTTTSGWYVYHNSLGRSKLISLESTAAASTITDLWGSSDPTASDFGLNEPQLFVSGQSVVWYAFAHDSSTDGIIQCGSFTKSGSSDVTVNLGWEPQYILMKCASTSQNWFVFDTMRNMPHGAAANYLNPNLSNAETTSGPSFSFSATGFTMAGMIADQTYIYLAIRRPNKPPTSGTQVYNAITGTATSLYSLVPPDMVMVKRTNGTNLGWEVADRLRGFSDFTSWTNSSTTTTPFLKTHATDAETTTGCHIGKLTPTYGGGNPMFVYSVMNDGTNTPSGIQYSFARAPGVFDVVAYTGNGERNPNNGIAHNLGVAPEMVILKTRSRSGDPWFVYHKNHSGTEFGGGGAPTPYLNTSNAEGGSQEYAMSHVPTSSKFFPLGPGSVSPNITGATYIAYLFATKSGISKVGSYTGNGSSQTIDCGFSAGARFFLVKATSTTGSWWCFDSVRGVISAADPALQLNSTAAEVTSADAVDPTSVGIVVNQEATCSINASGVSYIYLAMS